MPRAEIIKRIISNGVIAVIRVSDPAKLIKVAEAVNKGGISGIEITMTVPGAIKVIEQASVVSPTLVYFWQF